MAQAVGKSDFQSVVLNHSGLVLVDFWASWCGPCQMLAPVIEEIEAEHKNQVKVVKVDADAENELASQYNIQSLPTVLIFNQGQLISTIVGFRQKSEYLQALNI